MIIVLLRLTLRLRPAQQRWRAGMLAALIAALLLTGCAGATATPLATRSPAAGPAQPSPTVRPTTPPPPPITATPTGLPTATALSLPGSASPLSQIPLSELPAIVSQPFNPPRPGLDDGHHGVDFAFYHRGEVDSMQGWPVQAVFGGVVAAAATTDRPYGNLMLIETALADLPPEQAATVAALPPAPTPAPGAIRLTCPPLPQTPPNPDRALYLLYAHLDQPSPLEPGTQVQAGEVIGAVGTSGASVNYHLHLEARVGPAVLRFDRMGHYDPALPEDARGAYCLWRVSGQYALLDPLSLLLP